ncbi:MAG: hypothetical protein NVSMB55_00730 [Mycobacteriales bacterium]
MPDKAVQVGEAARVPDADPFAGLDQASAAALRRYVPDLADPRHSDLIRGLAASAVPTDPVMARRFATVLSGLVYWAEQVGQSLDPDDLMRAGMIAEYADRGMSALAQKTAETNLAELRRIRDRREGAIGPRRRRRPTGSEEPYTPDEVDGLITWCTGQSTDLRYRSLLTIAVFGLGAGLAARDLVQVTGHDIARDGPGGPVVVTVRRPDLTRRVPVLRRYEDEVLAAAQRAGAAWVVNPNIDPRSQSRSDSALTGQFKNADPTTSGPPLTLVRCRITWIVGHLPNIPITVFAAAAGVDASHLTRYVRYAEPIDQHRADQMLRGAQPEGS